MKRGIFNLLAALSLAVCLTALVLWPLSHIYTPNGKPYGITGRKFTELDWRSAGHLTLSTCGFTSDDGEWLMMINDSKWQDAAWHQSEWNVVGMYGSFATNGLWYYRNIAVSYWLIAAV